MKKREISDRRRAAPWVAVAAWTMTVACLCPPKAEAVIVTNVTTGTVIFNSSGFEHDTPGHEPFANLQKSAVVRLWKTAAAPWDEVVSQVDRYVYRVPPFANGGFHFLKTTRDAHGEGAPVARFSSIQATVGDLIRLEFCLQLPPVVDAKIILGHEGKGEYRGMLRLRDNAVQFHNGAEWMDVQPKVAFLSGKWQDWRLEYEIGAESFSVKVGDKPRGLAMALESASKPGRGSLNHIGFGHFREQSYFIDATDAMRAAAALCSTEVQASQDLPQLLQIDWHTGRDLPQGVQTVGAGMVGQRLIWLGGFCSGGTLFPNNKVPGKPDRYLRGYVDKTWSLDTGNSSAGWENLPSMPATARQAQTSAVVNDALYVFGGLNYSDLTFRDGYRLFQKGAEWNWEPVPELPWKVCFAGAASVGNTIFLMGGTDVGRPPGGFYRTAASLDGKVERIGARLVALDTKDLKAGWRELPACPGTPRFMPATAAVGEYLYFLGGLTGHDNPGKQVNVVVDNWRYDIRKQTWERLRDLPVASSRHPNNYIVYRNRYILLVSGGPTRHVMNPDGSMREGYGRPYRAQWGRTTFSDITVFDTETGRFGRANPMPICNNMPTAVLHEDRLYLIGGECEGVQLNGVSYGHHPDLLLIGEIRVVADPSPR